MTEQEIIKAWKENDRYFASPNITDEMREWAKKSKEYVEFLMCNSRFMRQGAGDVFHDTVIYRLRPDFELKKEDEIIEIAVINNKFHLVFACGQSGTYRYNDAVTITRYNAKDVAFAGYKYASGIVRNEQFVQSASRKGDNAKPLTLEFPVAVLFRNVSK